MLGIGLGLTKAAANGGGGAAAFNPVTGLSGAIGIYDFFDSTAMWTTYASSVTYTSFRTRSDSDADAAEIGFIMDKSQFASYDTAENLIASITPALDTDFSSSAGWTLGGNWQITGGNLSQSSAGAGEASYATTLESGAWYYCTATVNVTSGRFGFRVGDSSAAPTYGTFSAGAGTVSAWVRSNGTGSIYVATDATGFTGTISDMTVTKVPGNHLIATTNRPVRGTDGSGIKYGAFQSDFLGSVGDDFTFPDQMNIAVLHQPSAGSQGTYAGLVCTSQRTATVNSINLMGDSSASVWDFSLWISDPLTREYNRNTTDSTIQGNEVAYDENLGTWGTYADGAELSTGSNSNAYAVAGSQGRIVVGADGNRNISFDYIGNIYSVIVYGGEARNSDVYTWQNTQTGEQI